MAPLVPRIGRSASGVLNVTAQQMRVPDAAFAPATMTSNDWPISANGANTLGFRSNHWWGYDRMGMWGGYYELAGATDNAGDLFAFGWQGGAYGSNRQAYAAYRDGVNRTSQWGSVTSCTSAVNAPCSIIVYSTASGGEAGYTVVQINQCLGETKAVADSVDAFQSNSAQIAHVQGAILAAGAIVLKGVCKGATRPATAPARTTPSRTTPRPTRRGPFHGNCYAYRGAMWGYAQRASQLQSLWWSELQRDYNGNYPPQTGGSTPGATQVQFQAAQGDMTNLRLLLDNETNHTGLEYDIARTGFQYGIKNLSHEDPFTWVANRMFGAAYFLDRATQDEWHQEGSGLNDFHTAQQYLSNSWDALKQLPCH
jgi:hypothetical protein